MAIYRNSESTSTATQEFNIDGDKGDITVTNGGDTWTIDAGVVTTTKLGGDVTTAGKALLDDADAAAQRTTLGLGSAATTSSASYATAAQGVKADSAVQPADLANVLEITDIGVSVQAYSSVLDNTTASFTIANETKLDGIAAGAEVNVNADWNAVSGDALILNKPTLGTAASTNSTAYATAAQGTKADTALQPAAIGVSVQAYDADLTSWAAITPASKQDALVSGTNIKTINGTSVLGSGDLVVSSSIADGDKGDITVSASGATWTIDNSVVTTAKLGGDITTAGKALLDDVDASAQRTTLGLGTLATQNGTFSGTSSGTNTGDQNLFSTIIVAGQSSIVADTTSDNLTLVAGTNVSITTNSTTDTITISANDTSVDWSEIQNKPDPVITLAGDLTGNVTLTDLTSGTLTATIAANSVALGTDTTGNYVASMTAGTGITVGTATGEGSTPVITNTAPDQTVVLTAGTGISTSGTYPNFTITNNDLGSSQSIFKNVAVSGQSTVVADSNNDTLTLVAGANVTITTDAATDTITIASAGGGGGGSVADGDYGDITVSGTGTVWNIDAGVVTTTELGGDITTAGKALLDDADASAQRTTLGLVIGTNVQAYSSVLQNTTASFTTADETKLDGIATGAEVNVNADWNAVSGDAQILNKPTLGTAASTASTDYATAAQGTKADSALQPATIGVSVQAYDAQLADVAGLTPTDNGVIIGNGTNFVVESGATLKTSLGLTIGTDIQAYDVDTAKLDVAQSWTVQQTFKELKDTVFTITDAAGFEIDPANGSIQTITLGANRTPVATNFEAGQVVLLGIDDGTAFTITWTSVPVTWVKAGGTASAPTLATTGFTWVLLWEVGTTIYGVEVGKP